MANIIEKVFWTAFTAWHGSEENTLPYYPLEKLRRIQDRRVRAMVAFAYKTVPFYREFMKKNKLLPTEFRSASDLEKLPFVNNEDLSNFPEKFCSSAIDEHRVLALRTSGSTGLPKAIRHDIKALFLARAGSHRNRKVLSGFIGQSLGYKEVRVASRPGTGQSVLQFYKAHSWTPKGISLKRAVAHAEDSFEVNIRLINQIEPDVIGGFGSYIGKIYQWAWVHDVPIHSPKVICYGGDALHESMHRIIEHEFKIPVISRYQAVEALNIAYQCERREGFHISMDQVDLRIVDSDGNTLPPGSTGEIVISNLINRATVLINYRMGDLGQLAPQPCSCGRTLPTLTRLKGHKSDLIVLADGEVVHQSVLMPRLYSVPGVMHLQVIQKNPTGFLIKVVCSADRDNEIICKELAEGFRETVGKAGGISLDIERVDLIPQENTGKFRSIISLCAS
jgi:phenylacetate-CoA ligase